MTLGRESDYAEEAIFLCAMALKYAAADHPEDAQLQAAARRAQLIATTYLSRLQLELRNAQRSIVEDRKSECARCEYRTDGRCGKCEKYGSSKAKVGYIVKYLGEESYQCVRKYIKMTTSER